VVCHQHKLLWVSGGNLTNLLSYRVCRPGAQSERLLVAAGSAVRDRLGLFWTLDGRLKTQRRNRHGWSGPVLSQIGTRQYFRVNRESIRVDVRAAGDFASCSPPHQAKIGPVGGPGYGVNLAASAVAGWCPFACREVWGDTGFRVRENLSRPNYGLRRTWRNRFWKLCSG
jgi:hypothetical protein